MSGGQVQIKRPNAEPDEKEGSTFVDLSGLIPNTAEAKADSRKAREGARQQLEREASKKRQVKGGGGEGEICPCW